MSEESRGEKRRKQRVGSYRKMWPHQRAYYHWLNVKGWFRARWRSFGKWRYVQRWHRKNDESKDTDAS